MTFSEQRNFKRVDALNSLGYLCVNEQNGINTQQGIGRTLNISEGGVLLETINPLDSAQTIYLTIGLKKKIVDIKGKILWSKENVGEYFMSGIEFYEMKLDAFAILKRYLE